MKRYAYVPYTGISYKDQNYVKIKMDLDKSSKPMKRSVDDRTINNNNILRTN